MTRSVALELAPYGINVNAFAPGYVDMSTSDIYADPKTQEDLKKGMKEAAKYMPLGRWQKPEEIGKCIVFLASDKAAYITTEGIVSDDAMKQVVIDGGYKVIELTDAE